MNKRWIIALFSGVFFLKDIPSLKAVLPVEMEAGNICNFDFMKMISLHRIETPQTPLQVAKITYDTCCEYGIPELAKELRHSSILTQSKGFSQPFLKQVVHYFSFFQLGLSLDQIVSQEKKNTPESLSSESEKGRNGLFDHVRLAFSKSANPQKSNKSSQNPSFAQDQGSGSESTPQQENPLFTASHDFFQNKNDLENRTFEDNLILLSFKNPPPNSPGLGSSDTLIPPSTPDNFLRSFKEMAEHFYTVSIKVSAKQLAYLEEEEMSLSSSLLKPLLETPIALVLSYIASFFMLIIVSFADLRLGATTFGMAFSRSYTQITASLSYIVSFWEDWCVQNGLLPKQAFIRRL